MSGEKQYMLNSRASESGGISYTCTVIVAIIAVIAAALTVGFVMATTVPRKPKPSPKPDENWELTFNQTQAINYLKTWEEWGNRAVGYPNSSVSLQWLRTKLASLDCILSEQKFSVPVFHRHSEPSVTIISEALNMTLKEKMDFSFSDYATTSRVAFENAAITKFEGSGCVDGDWATFPSGTVAYMNIAVGEDDCSAFDRSLKAQAHGAKAVLFKLTNEYDDAEELPMWNWPWYVGDAVGTTIPVLSLSKRMVSLLDGVGVPVQMSMVTNAETKMHETSNIFCDTKEGSDKNMIIVGAHYDTVPHGPGVNDNGSGSATILSILEAYLSLSPRHKPTLRSKLRFAWWGAEELNLLGSLDFVHNADKSGFLRNVQAYINLDMTASPNGFTMVHHSAPEDGTTHSPGVSNNTLLASDRIAEALHKQIIQWDIIRTAFTADSDYWPFLLHGIPSSGFATGASELPSEKATGRLRRISNAPSDPCYHQHCDNVGNLERNLFGLNAHATIKALRALAT